MASYKKSVLIFLAVVAIIAISNLSNTDKAILVETTRSIDSKLDKKRDMNDTSRVYSCPMHPEVVSAAPGTCPKYGMELELQKSKLKVSNQNVSAGCCPVSVKTHHSPVWMVVAGGAMIIGLIVIIL